MFWTNWVKGYCRFVIVLGIIASVIAGLICGNISPVFYLIIPIGIFAVIISVSVLMMLTEISDSLNEINRKSGKNDGKLDKTLYHSSDNSNKSNDIPVKSNSRGTSDNIQKIVSIEDKWLCPECGKSNPRSSRVCKDCAYQR